MKLRRLLLVALAVCCAGLPLTRSAEKSAAPTWRAGTGRELITPPAGLQAMTPEVWSIFRGLFATLLLASAAGCWLNRSRPSQAIQNLNARIYSWWVMIVVGALASMLGHYAVVLLFALLSFFALRC